jgi:protein-S-isoprenylcysteine O-methyltransferase Ste14
MMVMMVKPSSARVALLPFGGSCWQSLQQSQTYDLLMRLPFLGWAFLVAIVSAFGLMQYLHRGAELPSDVFAVNVAMRLSTFAFMVLLAASVIARTRPGAKASGVGPRLSALLGTFLIYASALFPRRELSPNVEIASTLLTLIGTASAVLVLRQLGRSFSIMAEARQLVTSGIYRLVRHPLYLAEELAAIGVVLQFLSFWTVLILCVQIMFQLRRMTNEETILMETFSEYAAYCARTARLIPWVY